MRCSKTILKCAVLLQELLGPSSDRNPLLSKNGDVLSERALDIEDVGLMSEYAYALKWAFAEKFSVTLHDAELDPHSWPAHRTRCPLPI